MAGGLMQLLAYGAQDPYLTGNPQITFFKTLYRKHTENLFDIIEPNKHIENKYNDTIKYTPDDLIEPNKYTLDDLIWDNTFISYININGEDIIIDEEGIITIII